MAWNSPWWQISNPEQSDQGHTASSALHIDKQSSWNHWWAHPVDNIQWRRWEWSPWTKKSACRCPSHASRSFLGDQRHSKGSPRDRTALGEQPTSSNMLGSHRLDEATSTCKQGIALWPCVQSWNQNFQLPDQHIPGLIQLAWRSFFSSDLSRKFMEIQNVNWRKRTVPETNGAASCWPSCVPLVVHKIFRDRMVPLWSARRSVFLSQHWCGFSWTLMMSPSSGTTKPCSSSRVIKEGVLVLSLTIAGEHRNCIEFPWVSQIWWLVCCHGHPKRSESQDWSKLQESWWLPVFGSCQKVGCWRKPLKPTLHLNGHAINRSSSVPRSKQSNRSSLDRGCGISSSTKEKPRSFWSGFILGPHGSDWVWFLLGIRKFPNRVYNMSKDFDPSKHGHLERPQVSADFDLVWVKFQNQTNHLEMILQWAIWPSNSGDTGVSDCGAEWETHLTSWKKKFKKSTPKRPSTRTLIVFHPPNCASLAKDMARNYVSIWGGILMKADAQAQPCKMKPPAQASEVALAHCMLHHPCHTTQFHRIQTIQWKEIRSVDVNGCSLYLHQRQPFPQRPIEHRRPLLLPAGSSSESWALRLTCLWMKIEVRQ